MIVQDFSINWDYVQACFFALTILTTIGGSYNHPYNHCLTTIGGSQLNIELSRFHKLLLMVSGTHGGYHQL